MKKTFLIIIIFLISGICLAQKKGDNTVIVPGYFTLDQIKTNLFNAGLTIVGSDTSIISTSTKQATFAAYSFRYLIMRTDTALIFKPFYKNTKQVRSIFGVTTSNDDYQPLVYTKWEDYIKEFWKEVGYVVKKFSDKFYFVAQ